MKKTVLILGFLLLFFCGCDREQDIKNHKEQFIAKKFDIYTLDGKLMKTVIGIEQFSSYPTCIRIVESKTNELIEIKGNFIVIRQKEQK